jgi:hypothetical protein
MPTSVAASAPEASAVPATSTAAAVFVIRARSPPNLDSNMDRSTPHLNYTDTHADPVAAHPAIAKARALGKAGGYHSLTAPGQDTPLDRSPEELPGKPLRRQGNPGIRLDDLLPAGAAPAVRFRTGRTAFYEFG